ncbi:MAG: hypothetical protein H7315_14235 [Herminiimonas sp.]|nr:hypothetical protein [Herminiimonas sp.]
MPRTARVTRIHAVIANARRDFLHETTSILSQTHALVAIEALQDVNMSTPANRTVDCAGKNLRQKAGLNRLVLNQRREVNPGASSPDS